MTEFDASRATKPLSPEALSRLPTSKERPKTEPFPETGVAFEALPEGAFLNKGRYLVLEVRHSTEQLNIYLVESTTAVRFCPNCNSTIENSQEKFCSTCGTEISGVSPVNLRFLVKESPEAQAFDVVAQLLAMRLSHPALELPFTVFRESSQGRMRQYLVMPEDVLSSKSLPVPDDLEQVLQWGISLAQALAYLHHHYVTLPEVDAQHIVFESKSASWVHLEDAVILPLEGRPESAQYFTRDVQALRDLLRTLLADTLDDEGEKDLPPDIEAIFAEDVSLEGLWPAEALAETLERVLGGRRHPDGFTWMLGRCTDVGRERALNEDGFLTLEFVTAFRSVNVPVGIFAIADGVGGHEAGEVASTLTLRTVAQFAASHILSRSVSGSELPEVHQWLTDTVMAANQAVYAQRNQSDSDMGCTLVMALCVGNRAVVANVGDSRAYRLQEEGIQQITVDHSFVERLVAVGQITREEARYHPQKNVIYRVMGERAKVDVDLFDQTLMPGEALLLCSDGLSGMLRDEMIWQIWQTSPSPQDACERLVAEANNAGGKDNISVIIVQMAQ